MADSIGTFLKVALVGVAGYWAYNTFFAPAGSTATTATPPGTPPATTPPVTPPATPPPATPPPANSGADAAFSQLVTAMQKSGDPAVTVASGVVTASPYVFDVYLRTVLPALASANLDTGTVFPNGLDVKQVTAAQYWAARSAFLSAKGLLGLGTLGLGALVLARRFPARRLMLRPGISANYVRVA